MLQKSRFAFGNDSVIGNILRGYFSCKVSCYFQFVGLEIFKDLLDLGGGWLLKMGKLLTLAETTFLEVPPPKQLMRAHALMKGQKNVDQATSAVFKVLLVIFFLCKIGFALFSPVGLKQIFNFTSGNDSRSIKNCKY